MMRGKAEAMLMALARGPLPAGDLMDRIAGRVQEGGVDRRIRVRDLEARLRHLGLVKTTVLVGPMGQDVVELTDDGRRALLKRWGTWTYWT